MANHGQDHSLRDISDLEWSVMVLNSHFQRMK